MEKYENITALIAENLIYYRKKAKLTQSEVAAKLCYSDKSVSKWERAEGVPDIHVLVELAKSADPPIKRSINVLITFII